MKQQVIIQHKLQRCSTSTWQSEFIFGSGVDIVKNPNTCSEKLQTILLQNASFSASKHPNIPVNRNKQFQSHFLGKQVLFILFKILKAHLTILSSRLPGWPTPTVFKDKDSASKDGGIMFALEKNQGITRSGQNVDLLE